MLLKEIVQKTLQGNPAGTTRLKGRNAASLCDEIGELEKTVVDCISRLKSRVTEGEAEVASERGHAEQVTESLRANVAALEAKIRETEESVEKKGAASQKMEQTFTAKIVDLLNEIKKKDESLEGRSNEIKDLKSKLDLQAKQVTQLEQALTAAKAEVVSQAVRSEQKTANSKAMIAALEGQVKEAREIIRDKDSTITGLQSQLAKMQELENQIRTKEKDLAGRNMEVNDLRSEVTTLMRGIKEMSSFFKQAEAFANNRPENMLADLPPRNTGMVDSASQAKKNEANPAGSEPVALAVISNGTNGTDAQMKTGKETQAGFQSTPPPVTVQLTAAQMISTVDRGKQAETNPAGSEPVGLSLTPNITDGSREEIVPRSFFDSMTRELSEAFGPMAPVILRDHVKAVGESMEKFPKKRVTELIDNVSKEIANETIKKSFREHVDRLSIVKETPPSDPRSDRPNVLNGFNH